MKKRKLKAKKRQDTPIEKLRVMAEYGSSGIWLAKQAGVFRHSEIEHPDLRLPPELAERFTDWIEQYEKQITAPLEYDYEPFNAEGRRLAHALKRHIGNATIVEFQAETAEGGLCEAEEII